MIPAFAVTPPAGVRVLIATRPVDFRRGADGLSGAQLAALFEGLDWRRVYAPRIARPKLAQ